MKISLTSSIITCFLIATALVVNVANADLVKMCLYYKPSGHVRTDPILSQTCVSDHVHTFYGPQQFHPQTTSDDLRKTDPKFSTSVYVENKSLYWHPSIYKVGRDIATGEKTYELAEVSFAGPYYRWDKDAPEPHVEAFPKGFQMIAGFPVNGKLLEGVNLISECLCSKPCTRADGLCESDSQLFPSTACGEMGIAMNFPTCWNETAGLGDTGDHMNHMAYTVDGTVEGACPEGFNRRLPQIQLFVRIANYEGGQYTFSDNTLPADEEIFHADFMEGWMDDSLENIIENCVPTQNKEDPYNPPCACDQFLTRKETLLTDEEDGGSFDAVAGNICPVDVKSYIVDEEVTFSGAGGELPRGSCSAPLIAKVDGVDPPFVEECGLQFQPPTFDEENCDGGGGGSGSLSEDGDDDDDEDDSSDESNGDGDDDDDDSIEDDNDESSIDDDGDDDDDDGNEEEDNDNLLLRTTPPTKNNCVNSKKVVFKNLKGKKKKCSWVKNGNLEQIKKKCNKTHKGVKVKKNCARACGVYGGIGPCRFLFGRRNK